MQDVRDERDRQWAERVRRGDEQAFEQLFRAYYEDLCCVVEYYLGSHEAAEDLVQNIFCDLWDRRHTWHASGPVRAYLYRAARNKALDHLKHRDVRRRWEIEEENREAAAVAGPIEVLQGAELLDVATRAVEALPDRRRLVFKMVRYQGLTYAETAAALDISIKTVENQMGRAMKFLRQRLASILSIVL